jgi:hypothetical protein
MRPTESTSSLIAEQLKEATSEKEELDDSGETEAPK